MNFKYAEMSEWSNEPASKFGKVQAFGGSNPPLCARKNLFVQKRFFNEETLVNEGMKTLRL